MKNFVKKALVSVVGLFGVGIVHAHPGVHGADGMLSDTAHLLGEHGYLLILLLGIAVIAMRRSRRV